MSSEAENLGNKVYDGADADYYIEFTSARASLTQ